MLGSDLRAGSRSNAKHARACSQKQNSARRAPLEAGAGVRCAKALVLAIENNSARHGREYNAKPPLVDGFIRAIDSPRLFACARKIAGR
jgi:hypothetical protein